jgi:phosphate transport system substrate-binding protein
MPIPLLLAAFLAAPPPQTDIRVWGFDGLKPLLLRWEAAYTRDHPGVHFTNTLHGPASAMAGLYNGVADLVVMGREIWPVDTMAYHWVFQHQPWGLTVVTSGLNAPAQAFTPVVIVSAKNPLQSITLAQLDAIYGSEHRAAPANARTWGDLGLSGDWSSKPIHPFGYGPEDALGVFFRHDVLKSDFKPNPASQLLSDRDPGARTAADHRIAAAVAHDPDAIGYTSATALAPGLKTLPIASVAPTDQTLIDRAYPLTRTLSFYVNRVPDKPLPPALEGFLRFVLTPEAQSQVRPAEGFLPLTPSQAHSELDRLEAPMPPEPKRAAPEDTP